MNFREVFEQQCDRMDAMLGEGSRYLPSGVVGMMMGILALAQDSLAKGNYGDLDEILTVMREHVGESMRRLMDGQDLSVVGKFIQERAEKLAEASHTSSSALTQEELDALLKS